MGLGGSWDSSPLSNQDQKKADTVIESVIEFGITHFDHADIYTFGKAEQAFGDYIKRNRSLREKLFIQSKTGIILNAGPFGSSIYNLSKDHVLNQVDKILSRLSTDYLDALLLHRPDPLTSMEELAETLQLLKTSGKVKTFGVSNMSVSQIKLLQSFLDEPLFSNQVELSLDHPLLLDLEVWVNREESPKNSGMGDLLGYSAKNKMSIQAYSPLAQGKFSRSDLSNKDKATIKCIENLAEKYNTTPTGILLAWIYRIPANIHPIIGTTNLNRIKDSVNAMEIDLSREDWYDLWITSKGAKLP